MNRLRRLRMVYVLLIIALATAAWIVWPRDKLLLTRSQKLVAISDWNWTQGFSYQWLSDHELLYLQGRIGAPDWHLMRLDLRTNTRTLLVATEGLMHTMNFYQDMIQLSPDGKRVTLLDTAHGRRTTLDLDTGRRFAWTPAAPAGQNESEAAVRQRLRPVRSIDVRAAAPAGQNESEAAEGWMSDSIRRFDLLAPEETIQFTGIVLRNMTPPYSVQQISFPDQVGKPAPQASDVGYEIRVCGTADGGLRTAAWETRDPDDAPDKPRQVMFTTRNITEAAAAVHGQTVRLPQGAQMADLAFSRQGDRVAWSLHQRVEPFLPALIHRIMPSNEVKRQNIGGLWVSKSDGSDLHEIGHVMLKVEDPMTGETERGIEEIRWLPDGKHLSFLYHNALYTVPAE